jgi:tetratricopeptide (TPR) repeat protein
MDTTAHLDLEIGLRSRNQDELNHLFEEIYNPSSPEYHQFLTPSQFAEKFGPTEKDYQAVISFAKANGLSVIRTYSDRLLVDVRASVSKIEKAFHLHLLIYKHLKENSDFYAPDVEPSVNLSVPIVSVSGLDNYTVPHPLDLKVQLSSEELTGSGPNQGYMGNDFRNAYIPNVTLKGSGQKVALVEIGAGFYSSDISYYQNLIGSDDIVKPVLLDSLAGNPNFWNDECSADIEMVVSIAPGLDSVLVYEGSDVDEILNAISSDSSIKQISCSYYFDTDDETETLYKKFAIQGQSFFNGSGDFDAWGNMTSSEDDTLVTIVGGTTLSTTGPGGSYVSETVWNTGNNSGSGGGISIHYSLPSYQEGVSMENNQGSTIKRDIPDVALTADDIYLRSNNGSETLGAGTSYSTPLWAGFIALVNQQRQALDEKPIGFLNPVIYSIGKSSLYTSNFHDITTGNDTSQWIPDKFYAKPGYDLCTGWGTPNDTTLFNTLSGTIWSGTLTLSSNYTVENGQTLIILPGTKIMFTSGISLVVNGVLDAIGTPSEPITFTSTSGTSPSSWQDIELYGSGASGSTIEYSNINYGHEIDIENVPSFEISRDNFTDNRLAMYVYNSSGTIENNSLTSNSIGHSIEILYSTDVDCISNTITKTSPNQHRGSGIQYNTSSGNIIKNDISYCDWGIGAIWGSSPNSLLPSGPYINNRIRNCDYGLMVYRNSNPNFGIAADTHYGYNSIYDNTINAAVGTYYSDHNCLVYAMDDWWGSNPPNTSLFSINSNSTFYYSPYLTSDPWAGMSKTNGIFASASDNAGVNDTSLSPPQDQNSILEGLYLRAKGDYNGAKDFFKSYIGKHPDDEQGYIQLYACCNSETVDDIVDFFNSHAAQASKDNQLLLACMYMKEGKIDMAKKTNDKIISDNPNTALAEKAKINNMLIALFNENNFDEAVNGYSDVVSQPKLSTTAELSDAEDAIETYAQVHGKNISDLPGLQKAVAQQSDKNNLPKHYALLGNYPNPFNPSTIISYDLPEISKVQLTIYDILGREVRSFTFSSQSAGRQQITWNGRDDKNEEVASGVYLYHFKAKSLEKNNEVFEKSAKLILMK